MAFRVDNASDRPVYMQIVDQVKRAVALGQWAAGDKLPPIRELAGRLVINPNTIAKAYRQLERDRIIVTRPGAGTFVAELGTDLSRSVRRRIICDQLERFVVEAVHMQISKSELIEWVADAIDTFMSAVKKDYDDDEVADSD